MKRYYVSIVCIILSAIMCVGLISCSNNQAGKNNNDPESDVAEVVTNEDGEIVTNKDGSVVTYASGESEATTAKQGNTVKTDDVNDETTTKKQNKKKSDAKKKSDEKTTTTEATTKKETTTKKKKKKQTTTKKTTTTTAIYTTSTTQAGGAIETPEEPIDPEYVLTGNSAMYYMQERYDKEKFVVNLDSEGDTYAKLTVYNVKKNKPFSTVKVNLKNGKATETIKETGKQRTFTLGV